MAANEDLSAFVPKVHFEQIPVRNLVSNQKYQRPLSKKHVRNAAEHFDIYQVNPVKVSRRNGINYVFDGQHTVEIIAMVSGSRETPVWCMIYDDLDYTHEADIFANQKKGVKPLVPLEIFQANIEAENDKQKIIQALVESYNMRIGPAVVPGNICAISTLEKIYDTYGYAMLDRVLGLLISTWEGDNPSLSASVFAAMAKLLDAYGDAISDETFKERMSNYSIREIVRAAKDRRAGSLGYAEAMWIYYNKRSRGPIDLSPLHSRKKKAAPKISVTDSDPQETASENQQQ